MEWKGFYFALLGGTILALIVCSAIHTWITQKRFLPDTFFLSLVIAVGELCSLCHGYQLRAQANMIFLEATPVVQTSE